MAQILSNAHRVHVVNGHRITGLADEDRPIEFPAGDELATLSVGDDGGLYGTSNPTFGGTVTYRLQPTSPSVQWFIRERLAKDEADRNGTAHTIYAGTESDPVQGVSFRMEGGILMQAPHRAEPGQTYEAMIQYEQIIPNVDAGTFHAPLASPAAGRSVTATT